MGLLLTRAPGLTSWDARYTECLVRYEKPKNPNFCKLNFVPAHIREWDSRDSCTRGCARALPGLLCAYRRPVTCRHGAGSHAWACALRLSSQDSYERGCVFFF